MRILRAPQSRAFCNFKSLHHAERKDHKQTDGRTVKNLYAPHGLPGSVYEQRERLRAHGFDLTPRKQTDRGGIICLPLDKNLNGDVQAKHPDWEPVECPTCGRKCWKHPEAGRLAKEQGAKMLCTECAIKAGLLSPFRKEGPNRAQRRRAKRERRK